MDIKCELTGATVDSYRATKTIDGFWMDYEAYSKVSKVLGKGIFTFKEAEQVVFTNERLFRQLRNFSKLLFQLHKLEKKPVESQYEKAIHTLNAASEELLKKDASCLSEDELLKLMISFNSAIDQTFPQLRDISLTETELYRLKLLKQKVYSYFSYEAIIATIAI